MNKKLIINILVIVFSVKMMVLSALIFSWDRSQPPFHLVPDMDDQPRMKAQDAELVEGKASISYMLLPPAHTVSFGHLQVDSEFYMGLSDAGNPTSFIDKIPVKVDADLLNRGQDRFNIYCTVCHDRVGTGQGKVMPYATAMSVIIPNFHWDGLVKGKEFYKFKGHELRDKDGYIFYTITNGKGVMTPYGDQLSPADRWAIVAYIRALQKLTVKPSEKHPVALSEVRLPKDEKPKKTGDKK